MKTIKVLLVDDHPMVREGLRNLLEMEGDIKVEAVASDGREAVLLAVRIRPDVIVMDLAMPGLNGLDATQQLHAQAPELRVLVLTAHRDDEYIVRTIGLGVWGFVLKHDPASVLLRAVRDIASGKRYFSNVIARRLWQAAKHAGGIEVVGRLTPRESEVLQLIAEGTPNKAMASILSISIKTVEKHRHRLMEKLDLHTIAALTRYAMSSGRVSRGGEVSAH